MKDVKDKPLSVSAGAGKSEKRTALEAKARSAVEKFIVGHIHNSDFSRDTPAWNHFQAGLPVLIGAIADEMEG